MYTVHLSQFVCLLLEKVLYPENLHTFCVVLVKSEFFLNFCVFRSFFENTSSQLVSNFIHTLIQIKKTLFCIFLHSLEMQRVGNGNQIMLALELMRTTTILKTLGFVQAHNLHKTIPCWPAFLGNIYLIHVHRINNYHLLDLHST